jgi:hypothetical protein
LHSVQSQLVLLDSIPWWLSPQEQSSRASVRLSPQGQEVRLSPQGQEVRTSVRASPQEQELRGSA